LFIPSKCPKGWVPVNAALGSDLNYSTIFTTLSIIYLALIKFKKTDRSPTLWEPICSNSPANFSLNLSLNVVIAMS
jgi:hypothetical protein